jgi:hypothetical protein
MKQQNTDQNTGTGNDTSNRNSFFLLSYLHLILSNVVVHAVLVEAAILQELAANLALVHVLVPTNEIINLSLRLVLITVSE